MALPSAVSVAWSAFADAVDVSSLAEPDYERFTNVALVAHANSVGLDLLGDQIIDLAGREGASEYLAGELTMGLDIALRALHSHDNSHTSSHTSSHTNASTTAAPRAATSAATAAAAAVAKAAAEKAAAEAARGAAMAKLTAEERAALGLK